MKKVVLHLCADIGSDSYPYACDTDYRVRQSPEFGVSTQKSYSFY